MANTIKFKRGAEASIPIGASGEPLWTTDTKKLFIGDGVTNHEIQNAISPAALTKTDDTNVTLSLGGSPTNALLQATSITVGWSGQLAIARGGTGLATLGTANQLIRVNAGATALEYFTPAYLTGLTVGTTAIASGTAGRILFEGSGNVLQENAILNLDTTNGLIIGGSTARGTRLTVVNSSDTATVQNIVLRNAADSADRLIVYGDGNIKSLPTNIGFNASNELQVHIENTGISAANVGISFKGPNSHTFITNNQANQDVRIGQVVSGTPQPVLSFRYNNDFRAATVRGTTSVSASVGLTILNAAPNREWGIVVGNTSNTLLGTGGLGFFDVTSGNFGMTINGSTLNVAVGAFVATARLHIRAGSATANTAPLKLTTGTVLTTAEAGAMEYNNTFHLTNSDATRRHVVTAPNTTKVTAGAPYANDGFIIMNIGGTDFKIMTTA